MGIEEDGILPRLFEDIPEFANDNTNYNGEKKNTSGGGKDIISNTPNSIGIKEDSDIYLEKNAEDGIVYGGDETHFPPAIKYILGNEVCERYSYFAMKTILTNYLIDFMGYSSKNATSIGHGFNAAAYFFTLFGAYIADGKWGKYKTILFFSIIYCFGASVLAITAIPGVTGPAPGQRSPWGLILGLSGIAIGTGGIKPVVSAFCGDQFGPHQKKLLVNLFQLFYVAVNTGSFFSAILSPILRTQVGYWCAFIIPAGILIISIGIFIIGNKKYVKRKPEGSVFSTFMKIVVTGVSEKIKKVRSPHTYNDAYYEDSWLDRSKQKYNPNTVNQVKLVLRVLLVFTPLPFFWALYDQTGTRWIMQANVMDRQIGSIKVDSEIMGALNPLLVMIFVPIFEFGLYRPLAKTKFNFSPLKRMGAGMLLAVISFYIAAIVQLVIDNSPPDSVSIAAQIPQYVIITWGEILLSITGLEFAYGNSPKSMKTIVMAGWLLTVSIGNLFDAFVIELIQASEFILYIIFGTVMLVFIGIFILIAYHFKPINQELLDVLNGDKPKMDNPEDIDSTIPENEFSIDYTDNLSSSLSSSKTSSPSQFGNTKLRKSKEIQNEDIVKSISVIDNIVTTDDDQEDNENNENNIEEIDLDKPSSSSMGRKKSNPNSLNSSRTINRIHNKSNSLTNSSENELQEITISPTTTTTTNITNNE